MFLNLSYLSIFVVVVVVVVDAVVVVLLFLLCCCYVDLFELSFLGYFFLYTFNYQNLRLNKAVLEHLIIVSLPVVKAIL